MGSMWESTTNGGGNGHVRISPNIDQVVMELAARFPAVPPEALRTVVTEEFGVFDGAAISTFVPVLVVKAAAASPETALPSFAIPTPGCRDEGRRCSAAGRGR